MLHNKATQQRHGEKTRTSKHPDFNPQATHPTRRNTSCKPDGREHGHAHHPHPRRAQPASAIGPYDPCKTANATAAIWPGGNARAKFQALTPACMTPSLRRRIRASPLGPQTRAGDRARNAAPACDTGTAAKTSTKPTQRNAGQHSGYTNCSIHTLYTAEILQPANDSREEEARATTLCMAWHAQRLTHQTNRWPLRRPRRLSGRFYPNNRKTQCSPRKGLSPSRSNTTYN